ncbi:ATP-grasp domain-containing protein [Actinacidiphila alni]|uniref:D-alanine--D-alanine ligase family protein n=1 Tax=Actinacidiphila alni TaxID=380248 RepID=UPI0033D194AE
MASAEAAAKSLAGQADALGGLSVELIDLRDLDVSGLRHRIDVAFLACHGLGGEDGKIQGALDTIGLPYTGSGVQASAIAMDKKRTKELLRAEMIDTPRWVSVVPGHSVETTVSTARLTLGWPVFVKPVAGGGSLEAGIVRDGGELAALLKEPGGAYERFLIEEYLEGTPATVGVIDIDGTPTPLPVHTAFTDRPFYDYQAKHDLSLRREVCPADLPDMVTTMVQEIALRVHRLIGAHGVSRVDFLLQPSGRRPVLEVNTVPGLSEYGNLATMARAAGVSYDDLIRRLLMTAFTKPAYVP